MEHQVREGKPCGGIPSGDSISGGAKKGERGKYRHLRCKNLAAINEDIGYLDTPKMFGII